jgi:pimeloyl-ACP methyl ester carboxylesterase
MDKTAHHGILADFSSPEALVKAVRSLTQSGYHELETYTPYPVEELADYLKRPKNPVARAALLGGLTGGLGGFGMQWFSAAVHYPIRVAGRAFFSWPAFMPVTFELTILFASLSAFSMFLWSNQLPDLHHFLFDLPEFEDSTRDRFFLWIDAGDPLFDSTTTLSQLRELSAGLTKEITS